jgi:cystathionine gamma-synthase/methionine-gamma-lyase
MIQRMSEEQKAGRQRGMATRAIHSGERKKRGDFIPVSTPIYSSASFLYDKLETIDEIFGGTRAGFTYGRHENPTTSALEEAVAALEEADVAVASASGMASLHLALLAAEAGPGKRVLAAQDLYGVTIRLLLEVFARLGVEVKFANLHDPAERDREMEEFRPHIVLVETISNPLLRVADLPALGQAARRAGARLIVDNTFATPVLLRPSACGADFVVHSATKYFGGHGDVMGGVVAARAEYRDSLRLYAKLTGPVLGPFESWLVLRGIKTLPLRVERHCANACRVAAWLGEHPRIARVYFPGSAGHPDHALAARLFPAGMFGGLVSFELRDAKRADVFRFVNALEICLKAASLGDVQSLVLYPVISSHRDISPAMRRRLGIGDDFLRLSVGLEDVDDILADLDQALRA